MKDTRLKSIDCFLLFLLIGFLILPKENKAETKVVSSVISKMKANEYSQLSADETFVTKLIKNATIEIKARLSENAEPKESLAYWEEITKIQKNENLSLYKKENASAIEATSEIINLRKTQNQVSLAKVRKLRKNLIASANPTQLQRMFGNDLESFFELYSLRKYSVASLGFQEILSVYPYTDVADVNFFLAESYFAVKQFPQAIESYKKSLSGINPEEYNKAAKNKLALIYLILGMRSDLFQMTKEAQNSGIPNLYLSLLDQKQSNLESAYDAVKEVSSDSPIYERALYLKGQLAVLLNSGEEAKKDFEILIKDENAEIEELKELAKIKIGYIFIAEKNYQKADSMFMEVDKNFENYDFALVGSMWVGHFQKDSEKVIEIGESILKKYPKSIKTYEALSLLNFHKQFIEWPNLQLESFQYVKNALDKFQEGKELNDEYVKLSVVEGSLQENLATSIHQKKYALADSVTFQMNKIAVLKKAIVHNHIKTWDVYPALFKELSFDLGTKLSAFYDEQLKKENQKLSFNKQKTGILVNQTEQNRNYSEGILFDARAKRDKVMETLTAIENDIAAERIKLEGSRNAWLPDSLQLVKVQNDSTKKEEVLKLEDEIAFKKSNVKLYAEKIGMLEKKRDEVLAVYQQQADNVSSVEKAASKDYENYSVAARSSNKLDNLTKRVELANSKNAEATLENENVYLGLDKWGDFAHTKILVSGAEAYFYNTSRTDQINIIQEFANELIAKKDTVEVANRIEALKNEVVLIDAILKDNGIEIPELQNKINENVLEENAVEPSQEDSEKK
ncbi:hypothetical protein IT568_01450 [bacterium]|nr:hypothetical protein [bacterium]